MTSPTPSEERDGLVERLRERAGIARGEGNATATADAWHFEQAAAEITRLRAEVARKDADIARKDEALGQMIARFELYAGPNDIHAGRSDKALLDLARAARGPAE